MKMDMYFVDGNHDLSSRSLKKANQVFLSTTPSSEMQVSKSRAINNAREHTVAVNVSDYNVTGAEFGKELLEHLERRVRCQSEGSLEQA